MIQAQPVVPMGMTSRVIVLCVASWTGHMLPAVEGVIIRRRNENWNPKNVLNKYEKRVPVKTVETSVGRTC